MTSPGAQSFALNGQELAARRAKHGLMTSRAPALVLHNITQGHVVSERVAQPVGLLAWTLGLLARPPLCGGEALWLPGCQGVHTWGMRYAIDVVFVDRELCVVGVVRGLPPWRMVVLAPRNTAGVLEFRMGEASGISDGDRLELRVSER